MRRIVVAVLFLSLSGFGQGFRERPHLTIETSDGRLVPSASPAPRAGRFIVEFREAPMTISSQSEHRNSLRARVDDIRSLATVRHQYVDSFNGVSVTATPAALERIRALSYVKAIYADMPVRAYGSPTPPANVTMVHADALWQKYGSRGAGIVVAIIDTGIDYNHPALGGGFGPGYRVIGGHDFVNDDDDPLDDNGHGTHVAGIIGANGDTLLGVAPDVSFIAYKVLSQDGVGYESDVIAAIERTVDPNGDGNPSDHVQVANLSLGQPGNPDDPVSRAVDNASAAGVVFAIAAGNSGELHTIGSPGTARSAITVGAIDSTDEIASFSSRGPNMRDLAVKPEVCAPGVNIYSTFRGNGYATLSGTSMAAPHIAGVAALLRAIHPDWTPAQVKSAVVSTAMTKNGDVMSYGAGRVDAASAAEAVMVLDPPVVSFGLDPLAEGHWQSAARAVHLTNRSTNPVTLTFTSDPVVNATVTIEPPSVTIAAGSTADVSLSIDVDTTAVAPRTALGGTVTISGLPAPAHFAWGVTKSSRLYVTYDGDSMFPFLFRPDSDRNFLDAMGDHDAEALLAAGTFDFGVFSAKADDPQVAPSDARFIYRRGQQVDGDVTVAVHSAEASHLISFAARDDRGVLLSDDKDAYVALMRADLPPGGKVPSIFLPVLPGITSIRVNDMTGITLHIAENDLNFPQNHLAVIHHEAITGPVTGDVALVRSPADLLASDIRLAMPAGSNQAFLTTIGPRTGGGAPSYLAGYHYPSKDSWSGRLVIAPPPAGDNGFQIAFEADLGGTPVYMGPPVIAGDGRIISRWTKWPIHGDVLSFGHGPMLPRFRLAMASGTARSGDLLLDLLGELDEYRAGDNFNTEVTLTDSQGAVLAKPNIGSQMAVSLPNKQPRLAIASVKSILPPDIPRTTTVTLSFDNQRTDFIAPTVTNVFVYDGTGRLADELTMHSASTLEFSIADYLPGSGAQPIATESAHISYRMHGTSNWNALPVVQVAEDKTHAPTAGLLYRTDLTAATNGEGLVDIRIEAADVAGNTVTVLIDPAFVVKGEGGGRPRRRATPH